MVVALGHASVPDGANAAVLAATGFVREVISLPDDDTDQTNPK